MIQVCKALSETLEPVGYSYLTFTEMYAFDKSTKPLQLWVNDCGLHKETTPNSYEDAVSDVRSFKVKP